MMNGGPVSRVEPLNSEIVEATYRLRECRPVPSREIEPPKTSIGKYGISGKEEVLFPEIEADASRSMSRGMEHFHRTNAISFGEKPFCRDPWRSCTEMQGEAQMILGEPGSIEMMDCHASVAHMRYLFQMCSVIIVAMREHDGIDLSLVRLDCRRKDTGIDKNSSDKVGIRHKSPAREPRDWHA
jgi:hypothetical protein